MNCTNCKRPLNNGEETHGDHHVFCRKWWLFKWPVRGACHPFLAGNGTKYWIENGCVECGEPTKSEIGLCRKHFLQAIYAPNSLKSVSTEFHAKK